MPVVVSKHGSAISHETTARNADITLASIENELQEIAGEIAEHENTLAHVENERRAWYARRGELQELVKSAQADVESTEIELSLNRRNGAVKNQLAEMQTTLESALADLRTHEGTYSDLERAWEAQSNTARENIFSLHAKREQLTAKAANIRTIRARAFENAGRDVFNLVAGEVLESQERVKELERRLERAKEKHRAIVTQGVSRLKDWPELALHIAQEHGEYTPGPQTRLLQHMKEIALLCEEAPNEIDDFLFREAVNQHRIPLFHLRTYGPRSNYAGKDWRLIPYELLAFGDWLGKLTSHIAQLEQEEKRLQAENAVYHPGE